MAVTSDRRKQLEADIAADCDINERQAKAFHFWWMFLTGLTIAASAAAGLLGLGFGVDTRLVGAVALIPGVAASIIQQFKMTAKIDFHYRKRDRLRALVRRLEYGLPEHGDAAQLAKISEDWSELEDQMAEEWRQVVGSTSPRQLSGT